MAEKLCELKKKGGGELKETALWTNSSPTSSFASQTITLLDITPYKLIKVTFRVSTSNSNEYYELYTPDQLLNAIYVSPGSGQVSILGFYTGSARFLRFFRASSGTSIVFSTGIQMGGSDNNNYLIPIKISGLK